MKSLIFAIATLLAFTAHADYWSALQQVESIERSRRNAEFSRLVPELNAWITNRLTGYAHSLGGIYGSVNWNTFADGMIKNAEFKTSRGYECEMRIGMVLVDGSFNMVIRCASTQEGKRASEVFEHRPGRRR